MSAYRTISIVPYQPTPFPPELISTGAGGGVGASSLNKITLSSSTTDIAVVESTGAATLDAITANGSGLLNGANGSATLSGIIVSSSTTDIAVVESSGSPTLSNIIATTGTGNISVVESSGAPSLGSIFVSSGIGLTEKLGSGSATLSKATVSSSTTDIAVASSSGSPELKKLIISTGIGHTSAGQGTATLSKATVSSSTTDIAVASSSGSPELKKLIISTGIGHTSAGSGSANFHRIYVSWAGVGHISVIRTGGSLTLHKVIVSTGTGHTSAGSGAAALKKITVSSSTTKITVKESSGSATLKKLIISTGVGGITRPTLKNITVSTGTGRITVAESSGSSQLNKLIITTGIGLTSAGFGAANFGRIIVSSVTANISVVESSGSANLKKITVTAGTGKAVGPTLANIIVSSCTADIVVAETSNNLTLANIKITMGKGRIGPTLSNIIVSTGSGKSGIAGTGAKLVQSSTVGTSGSVSLDISTTSDVTEGNFLICAIVIEGGAAGLGVRYVTDNLGRNWERVAHYWASGSETDVDLWRVLGKDCTGGACTVTVTIPGSGRLSLVLLEYSGMGSIGDIISQFYIIGNSNKPEISQNLGIGELVVGFLGFSNTVSPVESVSSPFVDVRSYLIGGPSYPAAFVYSHILFNLYNNRLTWTFSSNVLHTAIQARFLPYYAGILGGDATLNHITVTTGTGDLHSVIIGTAYIVLPSIIVSDSTTDISVNSISANPRLRKIIVSSGIGIDGYGFGGGTLGAITVSSSTTDIAVIGGSVGAGPKLSRITASGTLFTGGYGTPTLGKVYVSTAGLGSIKNIGTGAALIELKNIKVTTGTGDVSVISTTANPKLKGIIVSIGIGQAGNVGAAALGKITVSSSTADISVDSTSASCRLKRITCVGFGEYAGIGYATLKKIQIAGFGAIRSRTHLGSGAATLKRIQAFGNGYPEGKGIGHGTLNAIEISTGIGYKRTHYYLNIHDSIAFNETPFGVISKVVGTIFETLSISEELIFSRIINNQINESLDLTEFTVIANNVFYRTISDTLPIRGGCTIPSNLNNVIISLPELYLSFVPRKKNFVSLSSQLTNTSILLPAPELGDTEAPQQKVISKRSMNNVLITYVRKNNLRKLNYTFVIGRPMALNLRTFLETNIANIIDMQNWKGEVWKVQVTNNPVEFTAKSLFSNEGEKYEIELELKGIRLI